MKNKAVIILLVLLTVTLIGCQNADVTQTASSPNEVASTEPTEEVVADEEQAVTVEVIYLPLIVNSMMNTEIEELYISQSNLTSWGENLAENLLTNEVSIELELPIIDANSLKWDFLLVDANGNEIVIPEVNFSNATLSGASIVFENNEQGEYFYFFL